MVEGGGDVRQTLKLDTQEAIRDIKKLTKAAEDYGKSVDKIEKKSKKGTKKEDRFVSQAATLLGPMFFFQGLASAISSATQPAMELAGAFEIIALILTLFFLPAVLLLLPHLITLVKLIADIPEPIKELVGVFIIFIGILATIAVTIISLILGFMGLSAVLAALGISTALAAKIGAVVVAMIALGSIFIVFHDQIMDLINSLGQVINKFADPQTPQDEAMRTAALLSSPGLVAGGLASGALTPSSITNLWNTVTQWGRDDNQPPSDPNSASVGG
jgi:hypothetical protein